jgi:hypothetical protein
MLVVKTTAEEGFASVPTVRRTRQLATHDPPLMLPSQCYADGGSNIRGSLLNVGVVERQNTAEKSVRAPHGAKVIDFGAAQRMETKKPKMSPMVPAAVPMAVMAAAACVGESD